MSKSSAVWGRPFDSFKRKFAVSSSGWNNWRSSVKQEKINLENGLDSLSLLDIGQIWSSQQRGRDLLFTEPLRNVFESVSRGGLCYFHVLMDTILERPQVNSTIFGYFQKV